MKKILFSLLFIPLAVFAYNGNGYKNGSNLCTQDTCVQRSIQNKKTPPNNTRSGPALLDCTNASNIKLCEKHNDALKVCGMNRGPAHAQCMQEQLYSENNN
ncbi:hypothetical protein [Morganella morganii]|uniref:hypothetical protein n=1 Tax=Morganella morganii TaxID=582 RepID=UPI0032DBCA01